MENMQDTRKWSEIDGMPVVGLANGNKVGTVDDFYFDPSNFSIYALRVKTGAFSHKVLHVAEISGLGQDAITTSNENNLQDESYDNRLSSLPSSKDLLSDKIMSDDGNVIGSVGHVILNVGNPSALRISAIELTGGILQNLGFKSPTYIFTQDIRYGNDVLIVPNSVAQSIRQK